MAVERIAADALVLLGNALDELGHSRSREGEKLKALLLERVARMEILADEVVPQIPRLVAAFQEKLMARIRELKQQVIELNGLQALNPDALYAELSRRECEVLDLIEQRYSNQGIGNTLYIELGTVKNHVHNILDKLGVHTRGQAATIARQALANAAVPIKM